MNPKANSFETILKNLRKSKGWTQAELAKKLGVVRTAISNYETGRAMPDSNTLNLLANLFNISIDNLLGRRNIQNDYTSHTLSEEEKKDVAKDLEKFKKELAKYEQTTFDGEPLTDEARQSIISAIEMGLALARQKNSGKV